MYFSVINIHYQYIILILLNLGLITIVFHLKLLLMLNLNSIDNEFRDNTFCIELKKNIIRTMNFMH